MATARVGTRLTSPESLKSSINAGPFRVLHAHQLRNPGASVDMLDRNGTPTSDAFFVVLN